MRLIFFGTSAFAAYIYEQLFFSTHSIVAVVTRPDQSQHRSSRLIPPPVKEKALQLSPDIPIYQPNKASVSSMEQILQSHNADLFIVVAYGEIIKENILSIPPYKCWNIHASLLPKYRGAAPMQRVLMAGEKETGISIIQMSPKMDAGPILLQRSCPVPLHYTLEDLESDLMPLAKESIEKALEKIEKGEEALLSQKEEEVTFAPKIQACEEKIDWNRSAFTIHNQIRALSPKPGAWCSITTKEGPKKLKIYRTCVENSLEEGDFLGKKPGESFLNAKKNWIIKTSQGALQLLEVQLEGKKRLDALEFLRGWPLNSPSLM